MTLFRLRIVDPLQGRMDYLRAFYTNSCTAISVLPCVEMALIAAVVKSVASIQNVPPGPSVTPVKITAATPNAKETVPYEMLTTFTPLRLVLVASTVTDVTPMEVLVGVVPVTEVGSTATGTGLATLAGWRFPLASFEPIRVESAGIGDPFGPTLGLELAFDGWLTTESAA